MKSFHEISKKRKLKDRCSSLNCLPIGPPEQIKPMQVYVCMQMIKDNIYLIYILHCVQISTYVSVCVCVCSCAFPYMCIHVIVVCVRLSECVYVYIYTHICVCVCVCVRACLHACVPACEYLYGHLYKHPYLNSRLHLTTRSTSSQSTDPLCLLTLQGTVPKFSGNSTILLSLANILALSPRPSATYHISLT